MEANAAGSQYKAHQGGVALFRAYRLHREAEAAWRADSNAQREEKASSSHDQATRGKHWKSGGDLLAEQREIILSELDTVMADLGKVFDKWSGDAGHLTELVAALRVGATSPSAVKSKETQWHVVEKMIQHYRVMQGGPHISKTALLEDVAAELDVSRQTAQKAWDTFLDSLPHQKAWVRRIETIAKQKQRGALTKKKRNEASAKQPRRIIGASKRAKPHKGDHFKSMKLSGRKSPKP